MRPGIAARRHERVPGTRGAEHARWNRIAEDPLPGVAPSGTSPEDPLAGESSPVWYVSRGPTSREGAARVTGTISTGPPWRPRLPTTADESGFSVFTGVQRRHIDLQRTASAVCPGPAAA